MLKDLEKDDWHWLSIFLDFADDARGNDEKSKTLPELPPVVNSEIDNSDTFDETKGHWVSSKEFCKKKILKPSTLSTYRNKGTKSKDGLSGTDKYGNHWKKISDKQNAKPVYFLPNDE